MLDVLRTLYRSDLRCIHIVTHPFIAIRERVKEFQSFQKQAKKRSLIFLSVKSCENLALLPSNHLEAMSGKRKGQFSIRIIAQWRVCFEWPETYNLPSNLEIIDYNC